MGPTTGGLWVEVTGGGFHDATAVFFGTVPATRFMVLSDTDLLALSPPHASGRVDVVVIGPGGRSAASPGDGFDYTG